MKASKPKNKDPSYTILGEQMFSVAHVSAKGKRPSMEDRCTIVGEFAGKNTQYYGIFDGHGGDKCSTYVANTLHEVLAKKINANEEVDIFDSIQESIDEINAVAVKRYKTCGCTAAIAIIIDNKLYTANVGDSRIILVNEDGQAQRLSYDHKVIDPNEQDRIYAKCGIIQDNRVGGVLALSRAIGDGNLANFIDCEAYMTENDITPKEGLIIACDGVWDVMTDQEAARMYKAAKTPAGAAKAIKKAALENKTTDNIVVVCVDLMPKSMKQK